MTIAVITYTQPHRKTQDLLFRLLALGYSDIEVIALPWTDRKPRQPLYPHRNFTPIPVTAEQLCERLHLMCHRLSFTEIEEHLYRNNYGRILIGGAGILPPTNFEIINSHPGYLPNVRGLDAYKWAILEGQPIGVTTHIIGNEPDAGRLIDRCIISVEINDTFHSVAQKIYETELAMLVEAISLPVGEPLETIYPVHGRMTHIDELRMMQCFQKLVK